jgi:hypothetical protein
VSEKSGVMKENWWTVVLVVVHRVFYSHFIISLKKYDMVTKTFLYIIIILCFVNKLNSSMSNFGGRLSQPKKIKHFLGISFFCQHNSTGGGFLILKQIIPGHFFNSEHIYHSRCFGIRGGHGKSAFKLAVKLSVELGYVFLSLRL